MTFIYIYVMTASFDSGDVHVIPNITNIMLGGALVMNIAGLISGYGPKSRKLGEVSTLFVQGWRYVQV